MAVEVWDVSRAASVQAAQLFLKEERSCSDGIAAEVALAIREAVNCSSQARQTPLHAAAEEGNAGMVKVGLIFSL